MNLAEEPRPKDLLWPPLVYLMALSGAFRLQLSMGRTTHSALIFLPMFVASLATLTVLAFTRRRVPFRGRGAWVAIMAALAFGAVTLVSNKAVGSLDDPSDLSLAVGDLTRPGELALAFAVVVFLVPVVEEGYFRGMLYPWMASQVGTIGGNTLAALLFALLHPGGVEFYILFVIAFIWGAMVTLTGNLMAVTVGHMAVNAVSFAMLVAHGHWARSLTWTDVALMGAVCLVGYSAAGWWASRKGGSKTELTALASRTLYSVGMALLISITLASLIMGVPDGRL